MIAKKIETNAEDDKLDTIPKRIKHVRGRISQDEFAQTLGTHRNTIARYEKGLGKPTLEFLKAMCQHYDIRSDWLLFGKEPIKEPVPDKEVRRGLAERLKKILGGQNSMKFAWDNGIDPFIMAGSMKGWISPNAENLLRIKRATGASLDWLVDGKNIQKVCQVDPARIENIYLILRNTLNSLNRKPTPGQEAQIYATLYEIYADNDKEIEISTIERMVSMAMQGEEKK